MKICLHIGPHKTGTTSVQVYLLSRFGSLEPEGPVWYPAPGEKGPGHAQLAALMNRIDHDGRPNALAVVVREAELASVETLILSSEDFVGAYPSRLGGYAEALDGHDVVLISTQSALPNRIASVWQEMVKHGNVRSIDKSTEVIFRRAGFRPDLLKTFAEALRPHQVVVVYSHPEDAPQVLIERVLAAMELQPADGDADAAIRRNPSLGWIEVELLRYLNQLLALHAPRVRGHRHRVLRNVLTDGFRSEAWKRHCPDLRIEVPEDVMHAGHSAARQIAAEITALGREWPLRILGDPEALTTISAQPGNGNPDEREVGVELPAGEDHLNDLLAERKALYTELEARRTRIETLKRRVEEERRRANVANRRYERLRGRRVVMISLKAADLARQLLKPGRRTREPGLPPERS